MTRPEFNIEPFEFQEKQTWGAERQRGPLPRQARAARLRVRRPWSAAIPFDQPRQRWVQRTRNRVGAGGLEVDSVLSAPPRGARDLSELYQFETLELEFPASMPTLRQGSRGSAVADLQRRLAAAGFSPGAADGIFGSLTEAAVRSFQRARGVGVDGIVGPLAWGALLGAAPSVPGGDAPRPQPTAASKLSGAHWVDRFPTSRAITSLVETFRGNVARFIAVLQKAGASVTIAATRRPPERAYLMLSAWRIVNEGLSPTAVPPYPGVDIQWVHTDSKGMVDLAASRAAAEEMVRAYHLAYKPTMTSRHIEGRAIDMTIAWIGNLAIPDGRSGVPKTITSLPRTGSDNRELWTVGASYGAVKLVKDPPHWSDDGH
jgi:hypothetical protein